MVYILLYSATQVQAITGACIAYCFCVCRVTSRVRQHSDSNFRVSTLGPPSSAGRSRLQSQVYAMSRGQHRRWIDRQAVNFCLIPCFEGSFVLMSVRLQHSATIYRVNCRYSAGAGKTQHHNALNNI